MTIEITFPKGTTEKVEKEFLDIIEDYWGSDSMSNEVFDRGIDSKFKLVDFKVKND